MKFTTLCITAVFSVSSICSVRADVIDQIGTFTPYVFNGQTAAFSQYDTGATPPNLPNFFTIYDNIKFTTSGVIDSVSWVGGYDQTPPAPATFTVSFYGNSGGAPGAGGTPSTLLSQYSVGTAAPTPTGSPGFIHYTTNATPFAVTAGTDYWMSVVATLNWNDAGWGVALSNLGDNTSVRDFGDTMLTREVNNVDYAVRVSTVPEPSGMLCLLGLAGAAAFRRRRSV